MILILQRVLAIDLQESELTPKSGSGDECKEKIETAEMLSVIDAMKALSTDAPKISSNRFEIEPWFRQQIWEFLVLWSGIGPSAKRLSASIVAIKDSLIPVGATPARSFFSFDSQQQRNAQLQLHESLVVKGNELCKKIDDLCEMLTRCALTAISHFSEGLSARQLMCSIQQGDPGATQILLETPLVII